MNNAPVPASLRNWFVIHFAVDLLIAVPLMLVPVYTLRLVGWEGVDPITARLVAAALFGIGIESFLGRNAGREAYRGMLNLKIIWSFAAVFGLAFSMLQGAQGSPPVVWVIVLLFAVFNLLWVYWRVRLDRQASLA
jgi:hypothetical protein